uniref:Uncharacterized protein n=1 Tax=Peronospora matthiolae TaxID=2874970 RepID=A0AAV1VE12_9STRA
MVMIWGAWKQDGVSLSTTKDEFVASLEIARKILGLREMLTVVGIAPVIPMKLHVDNQAAII